VWIILDEVIGWPEARGKSRGHKSRFVIVLQDEFLCKSAAAPATVLVIPCSSSVRGDVAAWDFLVPDDEPAFTKERVVAFVSQIQPILKTDLNQYMGRLRPETLKEVKARAQWVMAIQRPPPKIPDRSSVNISGAQPDPVPSKMPVADGVALLSAVGEPQEGE
jgi:mRNA-degrading endonuclease toxin of MazEF toxin-antitoxin module